MAYATDGHMGVSLTTLTAGTGTSSDQGGLHTLGETVRGSDGTVWQYVHASGAIAQYATVAIDENFEAASLTHTLAATGQRPGWAQVAFSDNDFGWVAIEGSNIKAIAAASCASDATLYSNTASGYMDDASQATSIGVNGVVFVAAVDTATSSEIIAHNAHFVT